MSYSLQYSASATLLYYGSGDNTTKDPFGSFVVERRISLRVNYDAGQTTVVAAIAAEIERAAPVESTQ